MTWNPEFVARLEAERAQLSPRLERSKRERELATAEDFKARQRLLREIARRKKSHD